DNGYNAPNLAALSCRPGGYFLAAEEYLAIGWDLQATHHIGSGGLAATGLTHDTDGLSEGDCQRWSLDCMHLIGREQATVAGCEAHFNISQLNYGICCGCGAVFHDLRTFLRGG